MQTFPPVPQPLGEVPLRHASPSQQPAQLAGLHVVVHAPQSPGQLAQSSPPSQVPLPQPTQPPQSAGQLVHDSPMPAAQVPSPHAAHEPQSAGHDEQLSPAPGLHVPSPHIVIGPLFVQAQSPTASAATTVDERRMTHLPYLHD